MERPTLTITIPLPSLTSNNPSELLKDLEECIQHFNFDIQPPHNVSFNPLSLPVFHGAMTAFCQSIAEALSQPYLVASREEDPNFNEDDSRYREGISIGAGLFFQIGPNVGITYRVNNRKDPT